MDPKTEMAILDLAIARGLISSDDLLLTPPPQEAPDERWGSRIFGLIRQRALSETSALELERELLMRASVRASESLGRTIATRGEESKSTLVPQTWGRYAIECLLGSGAMGTVYKAWDPMLKRFVALKVLHGDEPARVARFLQEARSQARVQDEHVCQVFDVGMVDDKPFIAMQWVDGLTLQAAAREMTQDEKLKALVQAVEGVEAAHRKGLVHRDLKPANIMVERTDGGGWKAVVLDFGLARDVEAPGQTVTGMTVGTPAYRSPEQARGAPQATDCRTDVYGLGATMYHVLTGELPFTGASGLEIMLKLLDEEAVSARKRQPSIPVDLDTIVMRCLEKEPARRYESARAVADDLRRLLDGEPIQGRRSSALGKISRKVRKNRVAVLAAGLGLLLALGTGGLALRSAWRDRVQARLAADFGQEARYVEELLRNSYRAPLHDVRPERASAAARLSKLEERIGQVGPLADTPGSYALGRGLLALGDHQAAADRLERAWKLGLRTPEVAFALGQALGLKYQAALIETRRIASRELREIRRIEAEATLRDPALDYLGRSQGVKTEAPTYMEGLLALYGGRHVEAVAKARKAFDQVPWLYEARRLEADAEVAVANDLAEKGELQAALAAYERAGRAYGQALEIGRSDPALHQAECIRRTQVMELDMKSGVPPRKAFEQALVASDSALTADPGRPGAYVSRSRIFWRWGEYQASHGEDPRPALEEAIAAAREAARLDPRDPVAYQNAGTAFATKGEYLSNVGADPRPSWDLAQERLEQSIRCSPGAASGHNSLGLLYWRRATYELKLGLDPRPSLDLAVKNLGAAAALAPGYSMACVNIGISHLTKGRYEMRHGMDPEPAFAQALEAFRKASSLNPRMALNLSNLAALRDWMGIYELRRGHDPGPVLDEALANAGQAVEIDPKNSLAHANGAAAHLCRAEYELRSGADPRPRLELAVAGFEKAISLKPDYADAWRWRGEAHLMLASYGSAHGVDPAAALNQSRKELEKAAEIDPKNYESFLRKGDLELLVGQLAVSGRRSAASAAQSAWEALRKALELNPRDTDVLKTIARLHRYRVEWRLASRDRIPGEIEAGLTRADEALAIDPANGEAELERGALRLLEADAAKGAAVKEEARKKAGAALRRALELNPLLRKDVEPLLTRSAAGRPLKL